VPQNQPDERPGKSAQPIRLLVADDQPVILRGLSMILDAEPDIEVIAQAKDGLEAERLALELVPDVIVMVRAVQDGKTHLSPRIARKIMDQFRTYDLDNPTLTADATPKSDVESVTQVDEKKEKDINQLTPKEQQILEFIAQGLSNKQIGANMFLAEGTVKNYVSRIMDKLHTRSRTELAIHALSARGGPGAG